MDLIHYWFAPLILFHVLYTDEVGHAHVSAYICLETIAKCLISTKQHSFNCLPYVQQKQAVCLIQPYHSERVNDPTNFYVSRVPRMCESAWMSNIARKTVRLVPWRRSARGALQWSIRPRESQKGPPQETDAGEFSKATCFVTVLCTPSSKL